MSDDTILETVGAKAQAIYDAEKAGEKCMINVPFPIGWIGGVNVSEIRIPTNRLDDVKITRSGITKKLSFELKKDD
jgi:hypothetical protein